MLLQLFSELFFLCVCSDYSPGGECCGVSACA